MDHVENTVSLFKKGHSCSQAVFSTYAPLLGVPENTALKIACSFGGGMARMGETCGAVTGAFMVLGLKYGRVDPQDEQTKEKTYELVKLFVNRFKSRNTFVTCRDLLGCDIGDPEVREMVEKNGLFDTLCPKLVQDAAEILEELL